MRSSDGYFDGVGGLRLYYRAWEQPRARAAIVVVHGLGDHSGRYESFANAMAAYGFSVFAFDLRGHGLSDGRRGHVQRFECLLQDVDRFRREVAGLIDYGCPVFILGHSMGGLIALRYLEAFDVPVAGGVIVAPWLATAMPAPAWKVKLAKTLNRVLPALPFNSGLDPDHISRDLTVVQAYRDDPLVHSRITPRLFSEATTAMLLARQRGDRIKVPLLFLLAGGDRIVSTAVGEAFARSLSPRVATVRVYTGFFHEVLNEPDRATVFNELRDWLAARVGPPRLPDRQLTAASPLLTQGRPSAQ